MYIFYSGHESKQLLFLIFNLVSVAQTVSEMVFAGLVLFETVFDAIHY